MRHVPDIPAFGPFTLLDKATRERLGSLATPRTLKQNETLIEERESSRRCFLLLDGSLRVMAQGEQPTLAIVGAPALVGAMAVLNDGERTASRLLAPPSEVLR